MPTLNVLERLPIDEASRSKSGSRLLIQIITPGWGTSGYYSEAAIKQAAADRVFPAGTHMYIDHPTESDKYERPERSVRDLAATLASDAWWNGSALVAEAYVFAPYRDLIKDIVESIGTSIRAECLAKHGEREGRAGMIVERFVQSYSVDFVTKAGRGGQILQVLESARDAGIAVAEATVNDTRDALQHALVDVYGGAKTYVWIRDFDDSTVWFEVEDPNGSGLYAQTYDAGDAGPTLTGDRTEVRVVTTYVPATRSDGTTTTESQETQMGTKQIEESEYTRLTEAAGRVETLESELNTAKAKVTEAEQKVAEAETARKAAETAVEEAKAQARPSLKVLQEGIEQRDATIARLVAENEARSVIAEALTDAWISDTTKVRLGTELLKALPLAEGKLDKPKLADRITAAVSEAEAEAAELLKAAGVGSPRGLGGFTTPATEASTAKTSSDLEEAFQELGLSESAAKTAVKGR